MHSWLYLVISYLLHGYYVCLLHTTFSCYISPFLSHCPTLSLPFFPTTPHSLPHYPPLSYPFFPTIPHSLPLSSPLSQVKKRRAVLGVDMAESEEPSSDQFLSNKAASLVYQQAVANVQRALIVYTVNCFSFSIATGKPICPHIFLFPTIFHSFPFLSHYPPFFPLSSLIAYILQIQIKPLSVSTPLLVIVFTYPY